MQSTNLGAPACRRSISLAKAERSVVINTAGLTHRLRRCAPFGSSLTSTKAEGRRLGANPNQNFSGSLPSVLCWPAQLKGGRPGTAGPSRLKPGKPLPRSGQQSLVPDKAVKVDGRRGRPSAVRPCSNEQGR